MDSVVGAMLIGCHLFMESKMHRKLLGWINETSERLDDDFGS